MDRARRQAYLTALVLLALAPLLVAALRDVRVEPDTAVGTALPDAVGAYRGSDVLICQSEPCSRVFSGEEYVLDAPCPRCASPLGHMAAVERRMLPQGTVILRKRYAGALPGDGFIVTVVLSGEERRSIHRPQDCLVSQGSAIIGEQARPVPLGDGRTLEVMCLRTQPAGAVGLGGDMYVYWFVAPGRTTPYHLQRLWWTAWDGVVHGLQRQWAYVAVQAPGAAANPAREAALWRFLADLEPRLAPR